MAGTFAAWVSLVLTDEISVISDHAVAAPSWRLSTWKRHADAVSGLHIAYISSNLDQLTGPLGPCASGWKPYLVVVIIILQDVLILPQLRRPTVARVRDSLEGWSAGGCIPAQPAPGLPAVSVSQVGVGALHYAHVHVAESIQCLLAPHRPWLVAISLSAVATV